MSDFNSDVFSVIILIIILFIIIFYINRNNSQPIKTSQIPHTPLLYNKENFDQDNQIRANESFANQFENFTLEEDDKRDFIYKKKKFTKRTPEDIKDLFDVDKMLPQEIEDDWFDTSPLMTAKKIKGSNLINPKKNIGINTVQSSLRNATHDIRGDIPNPKINISPWNNSTIDPDTNIKGLCNGNF